MKVRSITDAIIDSVVIALGAFLLIPDAFATNTSGADCVGQGACQTNPHYNTNNITAPGVTNRVQQDQHQSANTVSDSHANMSNGVGLNVNAGNTGRALTVIPVQVDAVPIITPSANVSRMVQSACGPRMRVLSHVVQATNNRTFSSETAANGVDQEVLPDAQPYRKVELVPGVFQILGHRMVETTAVVTNSTNGGFAFGGNGNGGAGGSIGVQGGGALQRMVTTIRLQECVVATFDERPKVVTPPKHRKRPVARSDASQRVDMILQMAVRGVQVQGAADKGAQQQGK